MIDAFIFDLDGTLLDSEMLWVEAIEQYLRDHRPQIDKNYVLELVYGRSWHDIYHDMRHDLDEIDMSLEEMQEALKPYFRNLRAQCDVRILGSIDLLRRLSEQYPVCIVSGSPREEIEDAVDLMDIGECLRFFMGAEDYSPGKPAPAGFLKAAERLGVAPSRCLVFEDSSAGVMAARRAGMYCVALAREDRPAQDVSPADLVLGDLGSFDLERFLSGRLS